MELFSEIYSSYYRAVEEVLRQARQRPLSPDEMQQILSDITFSESALTILPKLQSAGWPLIRKTDGGYTAALAPLAANPLSTLQKAWLKSILYDPRIHLFLDEGELDRLRHLLCDAEPLYRQDDFYLFDKALDSDDYSSRHYRQCFRLILAAIRNKTSLAVHYEGGKGNRLSGVFWPFKLEYSQKDDKFRAHCHRKTGGRQAVYTLNLSRITSAEPADGTLAEAPACAHANPRFRQVVIEITRERNALERCMVHFAHFEKRTEYDEATDKYICSISYNPMDETEVVIRILSFGPTVKVIAPDALVNEIKARVRNQARLILPQAGINQ